jgi:uncharacterized protein (DUF58 family)
VSEHLGRTITAPWRITAAHLRAAVVGTVCGVAAVALRRPDVLVLAAPLLVVATWSTIRQPSRSPAFAGGLDHDTLREGQATTWRAVAAGGDGVDRVAVTLGDDPAWTRHPRRGAMVAAAEGDGSTTRLSIVVGSRRWGRRPIGPTAIAAESSWGAFRSGPVVLESPVLTTLPQPAVFDNKAPLPHPLGLVGSHQSRRLGDGAEFAAIRPFAVGDRLRRIHWPVSLRTRELHVSSSHVDVDSQVVLVVDVSSDVGEGGDLDGPASSLDRSVRAAGALAEHFLRRGDRVGLRTTGAQHAVDLPAAAGQSHLRRLLFELALIEAGARRDSRPRRLGIDPGAVVVVLTPLLSPAVLEHVVTLVRRHLTVLVVDTLPDDIVVQAPRDAESLAWRVCLLERDAEIRRLGAQGVPVAPWRGPGSLDAILRDVRRSAAAPRLAVR